MSHLSVLILFTIIQYSLCSPHSGEDHSSGEDHDVSYEHDGWRYAYRPGNRSRRPSFTSPTLMNLLAILANGSGRQQTTPSADDFDPSLPNVRPSLLQGLQQEVLLPVQGLSNPNTNEKPSTEGPIQPQRPQGGWGVQLMDPALNISQSQG